MPIKVFYSKQNIAIGILPSPKPIWQQTLDKIKEIPGRKWDKPIAKHWNLSPHQIEDILEKFNPEDIVYADKETEKAFTATKEVDERPLEHLPQIELEIEKSIFEPKDFQSRYILLNESKTKLICSLPCGAGKTFTALQRIKMLERVGVGWNKLMVICPKRARTNWRTSIREFFGKDSFVFWAETKKKREKLLKEVGNYSIFICTYETAKEFQENTGFNYEQIIIDEVHLACNQDTLRFKAADLVVSANESAGVQCLSATPIQHKPKDLWGPLHFVAPKVAGAAKSWENRYQKVVTKGKRKTPVKNKAGEVLRDASGAIRYREYEYPMKVVTQNLPEMSQRTSPYIFRVSKDEVFDFEYPVEPIFIEMSTRERKLYSKIKEELLVELDNRTLSVKDAPVKMLRLLQAAEGAFNFGQDLSSSKLEYVKEYVEDLGDETCIIWSRFNPITGKIQQLFPDKTVVYNGSQPDYMNQLAIWAFNGVKDSEELREFKEYLSRAHKNGYHFPFGPGEAQLFTGVMDLRSTLAVDLHQRCSRQLATSVSFMGTINEQTFARLIRLGQKEKLVLTNPIFIEDTIEAGAWALSLKNYGITQSILDGEGSMDLQQTRDLIKLLEH